MYATIREHIERSSLSKDKWTWKFYGGCLSDVALSFDVWLVNTNSWGFSYLVRLIFFIIVLCDLLKNKLAKKIAFFRKDPAGIFDLVEVVGNGTYGQVHKVQCIQHLVERNCFN